MKRFPYSQGFRPARGGLMLIALVAALSLASRAVAQQTMSNDSVTSLIWTGSVNGNWNFSTANWTGGGTVFANGDAVTFNDTAPGTTTITVAALGVDPSSVLVNNSEKLYIIDGGPIGGSGSLTKDGEDNLLLGDVNTYTGATVLNGGILAPTVDDAVPMTSAVTVGSAALFALNGYEQSIGSLSGSGTVSDDGATGAFAGTTVLTVGNDNTSTTFSGVLADAVLGTPNESLSINKVGTGTLTLTGSSTYTGTTTISGGVLSVNNLQVEGATGGVASSIGAGSNNPALLVFNGGTLQYTGTGSDTDRGFILTHFGGTIDASGTGPLNIETPVSGGNIYPVYFTDPNSPATLTFTGSYGTPFPPLRNSETINYNLFQGILVDPSSGTNLASIVKSGPGTWAMQFNDNSGPTQIQNGTLLIWLTSTFAADDLLLGNVSLALGAGTVNLGGPSGSNSASLLYAAGVEGLVFTNPITIQDTTTGTLTIGGLDVQNSVFLPTGLSTVPPAFFTGPDQYAGNITLGATPNVGKSVTLGAAGEGEVDFTGNILANGTDTTAGLNIVNLSGPNTGIANIGLFGTNTYHGGTTINANARVFIGSTGALGSGPVYLNGGTASVTLLSPNSYNINGFNGGATWTVNSDNVITPPFPKGVLQLTDGQVPEARSAFFNTPVPVIFGGQGFTLSFIYTPTFNSATPDNGFTFVMQNDPRGLAALGGDGTALGYGTGTNSIQTPVTGMTRSVAVAFNIDPNTLAVPGGPGYALGENGTVPSPAGSSYTMLNAFVPNGMPLKSGDKIQITISYNPATDQISINDVNTSEPVLGPPITYPMDSVTITANLASILGSSAAFIGFTGGDSANGSTQQISNFQYSIAQAAGPISVSNAFVLEPGTTSGLDVGTTPTAGTVTVGPLTVAAGAPSILNVTAAGVNVPLNTAFEMIVGAVALNANVTINVIDNGTSTGTLVLGAVNDGGSPRVINLGGPGTVTFSAAATSLVDGTQINVLGGTLTSSVAGALGSLAQVTVAAGALFNVNASQTIASLSGGGGLSLNTGTLTIGGSDNLSNSFSGPISGPGSLTLAGTGTLTLGGPNTFSGGVTIPTGDLVVDSPTALGNGSVKLSGGTLTLAVQPAPSLNAVVVSGNSTVNVALSPSVTLGALSIGTATLNVTGGAGVANAAYGLTFGATTLTGNPTFNVADNGTGTGTLTLGAFNDGGTARTIKLAGSGTLQLGTAATKLVAGTTVDITSGELNAAAAGALGTTAQVNVSSGALFNLSANQTVSALTGTGNVNLNTNTLTVGSTDHLASTFSGTISDTGSGGGLTTAGTGTVFTLATPNIYIGPTTVGAGSTLAAANTSGSATGVGAVTVQSGGKLSGAAVLGEGFISGPVTVNSGGTIAGSIGGALTLGMLTLQAGSISSYALGLPTGTSGPALIHTSLGALNSLTINGGVTVNGTGSVQYGGTYDLLDYTGSPLSTTAFNNFSIGTIAGGFTGQLVNNTAQMQVDLLVKFPGTLLTWTGQTGGNGAANSSWDTASTNWANGTTASTYTDGNNVVFGDTNAANGNAPITTTSVSIQAAGVSPSGVVFTNSKVNYTLSDASGAAGISGSGTLVVQGSGTDTLQSANSFTGPVFVDAGQLVVQNGSALGTSSGVTVFSGGALVLQGGITLSGIPLTLSSAGLAANPAGGLNSNGGANFYAGLITAQPGGAFISSSSTAAGDLLTLSGGLNTGSAGTTLTILGAGNTVVTGAGSAITGSGALTKNNAGTLTLATTAGSTYSGGTMVIGGVLLAANTSGSATGPGAVTVTTGGTLAGSGSIGGPVSLYSSGADSPLNPAGNGTYIPLPLNVGASLNGHLSPSAGTGSASPTTLTINNTLSLDNFSFLDFFLDKPTAGGSDLVDVMGTSGTNGNLGFGTDLTLNITAGPDFTTGVYPLIDFTGALTDNSQGFARWAVTGGGSVSNFSYAFSIANGSLELTVGAGAMVVDAAAGANNVVTITSSQLVGSLSSAVAPSGSATLNVVAGTALTVNQAGNTTFAGTLVNSGTLDKRGAGILEFDSVPTLSANSTLQIDGGTLRFNVNSGTPSVPSGTSTAQIASGATLELAGSVSALNPSVNIVNNSQISSGGLLVSGTGQQVGRVTGSGNVAVGIGGSLAAAQIAQYALIINGTVGNPGKVTLIPSGSGSTLNPTGPNDVSFVSAVNSLTIANDGLPLGGRTYFGTLDIGNNGLIVAYGSGPDPYASIVDMVRSGYAGGFWNGNGITSSLARAAEYSSTPLNIGLMDFTPGLNNDPTFLVFEGQTLTTNAVLLRLTYMDDIYLYGDMSPQHAGSDALAFAANYGSGTTWSVGDLTHDGLNDAAAALLFAANYDVGLPSLDGGTAIAFGNSVNLGGAAAVPEPSSAALAAIGAIALGLLARRRRGRSA